MHGWRQGLALLVVVAAVTAFAESGFHATSLRGIADAVAIITPTLLHHFGSKEALYSVVLERIRDSLERSPMHAAICKRTAPS